MPKPMVIDECHGIAIAMHTEHAPTDVEWAAHVRMSIAPGIRGLLVVSEGGGPNVQQRAIIDRFPHVKPVPAAVVTHSAVARGVVTAIRWLGKSIRAFAPEDLDDAFRYLGVDEGSREEIVRRLASLKDELVGRPEPRAVV